MNKLWTVYKWAVVAVTCVLLAYSLRGDQTLVITPKNMSFAQTLQYNVRVYAYPGDEDIGLSTGKNRAD